jgi:hypothetical protein
MNYDLSELLQKLLLAVFASMIPIAFANFMVWKRKLPPSLFIRFPWWKKLVRDPLVIMVVTLQFLFFFVRDTGNLFEPSPRPGMIVLTTVLMGTFTTLVMTLIYIMARNTFSPREEKDAEFQ